MVIGQFKDEQIVENGSGHWFLLKGDHELRFIPIVLLVLFGQPGLTHSRVGDKLHHCFNHILQLIRTKARIQADPEGPIGNDVGIGQFPHHPILAAPHIGLADQIPAEQQARPDLVPIEMLHQLIA